MESRLKSMGLITSSGDAARIELDKNPPCKIQRIAEYYGVDNQMNMMIEESSEFTVAVNKYRRNLDGIEHIKEELADVIVIACQLRYLLGKDEIDNIINAKIDRQIDRINKEQNSAAENLSDGAKWEISSDGYYPYCSKCNARPEGGKLTKYCAECGAKMGGTDGKQNI